MNPIRSVTPLICIVLAICGCSEAPESAHSDKVEVVFDLGPGGFENSDAARLVGAMRVLVEKSVDPIRVRFVLRGEALTFDVLGAEPQSASPLREIDFYWIQVGTDLVRLHGNSFADAEFSDWLQSYANFLSQIQEKERSALVIDVEDGVDSGRLFDVLRMLVAQGVDQIFVERHIDSETKSQDFEKPKPPSGWLSR